MKLIVGLGNPGRKYAGTRHNVGFEVLDEVARRWNASPPKSRFQGLLAETQIGGQRVLLLWPGTFMNRSGGPVQEARSFFKLENNDVLVICDDFNLALAKLRFRAKGSAGGQKGLADILQKLGGEEVPRLRIGIGIPAPGRDVTGFVLGKFSREERHEIDVAVVTAADAAADWVTQGLPYCMNKYN